jgi:hypothetical protein
MKQVTIISEDRPGLLSDISYILGKSGITIQNLNVDVVGTKALISLAVKDAQKAKTALEASGYSTAELNALLVKVSQKFGGISGITKRLSEAKININGFNELSSNEEMTVLSLHVDKPRKATKMLTDFSLLLSSSY